MTNIDYTSKDFAGFKQSLLDYAAVNFPEWTGRSEADFGVLLVELFAYLGDILSFYGDRAADEAFLATATQRRSVINLALMLGYTPAEATAATGSVNLITSTGSPAVSVPAGTAIMTPYQASVDGPIFFETTADVTVAGSGGISAVTVIEGLTQGSTTITVNSSPYKVEIPGSSDGTSSQVFVLRGSPVISGSVNVFTDASLSSSSSPYEQWNIVNTLVESGPSSRDVLLSATSTGVTYLTFGDGTNGFVPPIGTQVYVNYRVGGGVYGNVSGGGAFDFVETVTGVSVGSSTDMSGGADAESIESIRRNAPRAFRTIDRAVSLQDYEDLAVRVGGLADANAVAGSGNAVTVFIIGTGGNVSSTATRNAVSRYLSTRIAAGTTVLVNAATTVGISVGNGTYPVQVTALPSYSNATVKAAVIAAITNLMLPDNWTIGAVVPLSLVLKTIQDVPGVAYASIPVFYRAGTTPSPGSVQTDIIMAVSEFPYLNNTSVTVTGGVG
jgi:hypothetical protein